MPSRTFDSGYWDHPDIQPLSRNATFLYVYLWTNSQCLPSGLYPVTPRTMSFGTKIPEADIAAALDELVSAGKIEWFPEESLVWVKNFVKRQSRSPQFLTAVSKALRTINSNGLVDDFISFNRDTHNLLIPYPYPIHTHSVGGGKDTTTDTDSASVSVSEEGGSGGDGNPDDKDAEMAVVARLYEKNIGPLTERLSHRLKFIVNDFPRGWFLRAVDEACYYNKRNLAYIETMMERWQVDGLPPDITEKRKESAKGDPPTGSPARTYKFTPAPDEKAKA